MKFIVNCFKSAYKTIFSKTLILFLTLTVAGLLCLAVVDLSQNFLEEKPIKIAVFTEDAELTRLVSLASSIEIIKERVEIVFVSNFDELFSLISNYQVLAGVFLEYDMLESIWRGENMPVDLYLNDSLNIDSILINIIKDSFSQILNEVQINVYATLDIAKNAGFDNNNLVVSTNLAFVYEILEINNTLQDEIILYSNNFPLDIHYGLSIWIYLLFISTFIFFDEILFKSNQIKMLSNATNLASFLYISKILILSCIYGSFLLIPFFLLNLSFTNIFSLFIAGFFIICVQILIFNLFSDEISSIVANFIAHTLFLFISGGIIPKILLPDTVNNLAIFTPEYHVMNIFVDSPSFLMILFCFCVSFYFFIVKTRRI
ncbi:MAG: hypothetical protein R3Y12_01420 [Clostridia bacterium]